MTFEHMPEFVGSRCPSCGSTQSESSWGDRLTTNHRCCVCENQWNSEDVAQWYNLDYDDYLNEARRMGY